MRVVFLLAALALTSCGAKLNPVDPQVPDTVAGRAAADQQRAYAESLCGPQGQVSQRDDTDGTRAGDWKCERVKP